MDKDKQRQIKSLAIKGFDKSEIAQLLDMEESDIKVDITTDIAQNSEELYSELQKDLSKLVFTEINKPKRDSTVILNAIKLQADLQEKKITLSKKVTNFKVSNNYIHKRDEEMGELRKTLSVEEIAKKLKVSEASVKQALDRHELNLPAELRDVSASIISETAQLQRDLRIKIIRDAKDNKRTKRDVRDIVTKIKNETK